MLYRTGSSILAIAETCSHRGGPLHEGDIDANEQTVTCPWHGSQFSMTTGDG